MKRASMAAASGIGWLYGGPAGSAQARRLMVRLDPEGGGLGLLVLGLATAAISALATLNG